MDISASNRDVLLAITFYLSPLDLIKLTRADKRIYQLTKTNNFWGLLAARKYTRRVFDLSMDDYYFLSFFWDYYTDNVSSPDLDLCFWLYSFACHTHFFCSAKLNTDFLSTYYNYYLRLCTHQLVDRVRQDLIIVEEESTAPISGYTLKSHDNYLKEVANITLPIKTREGLIVKLDQLMGGALICRLFDLDNMPIPREEKISSPTSLFALFSRHLTLLEEEIHLAFLYKIHALITKIQVIGTHEYQEDVKKMLLLKAYGNSLSFTCDDISEKYHVTFSRQQL